MNRFGAASCGFLSGSDRLFSRSAPFFQGDSNGGRSRVGPLLQRDPHHDLWSVAPASIFNTGIHPEASTPFLRSNHAVLHTTGRRCRIRI